MGGAVLGVEQRAAAVGQQGARAVDGRQHLADGQQHGGPGGRVGGDGAGDQVGDGGQGLGLRGEAVGKPRRLGRGGDRLGLLGGVTGGRQRGVEGARSGEEGEGALGRTRQLARQVRLHAVQRRQVELRQLPQQPGAALRLPQLGEEPGPGVGVGGRLAVRAADQ